MNTTTPAKIVTGVFDIPFSDDKLPLRLVDNNAVISIDGLKNLLSRLEDDAAEFGRNSYASGLEDGKASVEKTTAAKTETLPFFLPFSAEELFVEVVDGKVTLDFELLQSIFNKAEEDGTTAASDAYEAGVKDGKTEGVDEALRVLKEGGYDESGEPYAARKTDKNGEPFLNEGDREEWKRLDIPGEEGKAIILPTINGVGQYMFHLLEDIFKEADRKITACREATERYYDRGFAAGQNAANEDYYQRGYQHGVSEPRD